MLAYVYKPEVYLEKCFIQVLTSQHLHLIKHHSSVIMSTELNADVAVSSHWRPCVGCEIPLRELAAAGEVSL